MMTFAARCYAIAVIFVAAGVSTGLLWSPVPLPRLLILACAAAVAQRVSTVRIGPRTLISVSLVVCVASMIVLPPAAAASVGIIDGLAEKKRTGKMKTTFNAAMCGVVLGAGSGTYLLLGGHNTNKPLHFPGAFIPFLTAVTACVFLNSLLLSTIIALDTDSRFLVVWSGVLSAVAMSYVAASALSLIMVAMWDDDSFGASTALLAIVPMFIAHWVMSQYAREQAAYDSTINALVQAVEIKDHYTRGHSERVAKGSELIARQMKLPEERIGKLHYAGLLHDIGKLSVPTRLLEKTGKLTDDEYREIQLHPAHGVAVIRDITFLTEVYEAILYHHERLDGRGYPQGRRGDEIPEFARIIGVADAFDAMTSTRSYRAARPVPEAVAELWKGAGTQFDPQIVRAFDEALVLQEKAGHPWQITDKIADETADIEPEARIPAARAEYSFGDHDDPYVAEKWNLAPQQEESSSETVESDHPERERLHSGPNLLNDWFAQQLPIEESYPRIGSGPYQLRERPQSALPPEGVHLDLGYQAPPPLERRLDEPNIGLDTDMPVGNYRDDVPALDQFLNDVGPDAEVIPLRRRSDPPVPYVAEDTVLPRFASLAHERAASEPAPVPQQARPDHDDPTVEMPRVQSTGSAE